MISQSQLSRLNYQLEALDQILVKVPSQLLAKQIQPGKWSIQENLGHLLRYQEVSTIRFNMILQEQEPLINRYIAEEDDDVWCFQNGLNFFYFMKPIT